MLDGHCSDVMEAQQWKLGRDVMMDSYTQYLQQVRKTLSGLADFLLKLSFTPLTVGQEDMEEHYEYK